MWFEGVHVVCEGQVWEKYIFVVHWNMMNIIVAWPKYM
jgi:hypothetical protein